MVLFQALIFNRTRIGLIQAREFMSQQSALVRASVVPDEDTEEGRSRKRQLREAVERQSV